MSLRIIKFDCNLQTIFTSYKVSLLQHQRINCDRFALLETMGGEQKWNACDYQLDCLLQTISLAKLI